MVLYRAHRRGDGNYHFFFEIDHFTMETAKMGRGRSVSNKIYYARKRVMIEVKKVYQTNLEIRFTDFSFRKATQEEIQVFYANKRSGITSREQPFIEPCEKDFCHICRIPADRWKCPNRR